MHGDNKRQRVTDKQEALINEKKRREETWAKKASLISDLSIGMWQSNARNIHDWGLLSNVHKFR